MAFETYIPDMDISKESRLFASILIAGKEKLSMNLPLQSQR